jgi:hypothetical protein
MRKFNPMIKGFLFFAALFSFVAKSYSQLPQVTTYINNFDGTAADSTWKPEHASDVPTVFTLSQADGALTVVVDKNTGIDAGLGVYGFSSLSLDLSNAELINLSVNPFIRVRLKASAAFSFGIGVAQADSGTNNVSLVKTIPGDNTYHTYIFNFTGMFQGKYDSTAIDKFFLNFNPGWAAAGKYAGTVTFDFLKIGDAASALPTVTSFIDQFDGTDVSALWTPEHANDVPTVFTLTQADGALKVVIDKNTGIDAGIGVYGFSALALDMSTFQSVSMASNPLVKIRLKTDKAFTLGVGPVQLENGGNDISLSAAVPGDNAYHTYLFDFTGKFGNIYDSTMIDKFYLNFNPGWAAAGKYAGTVTFDFLKIGDAAAALPSVTTFVDNFDGSDVSAFWVPEHANDTPKVFELTQQNGELNINVDKNTGINAGIGVYGFSALALDMSTTQAINMAANPYVQVKLKADAALTFQVGPVQVENGGNNIGQNITVPGDNEYHLYTLDFTGKFGNNYDSTQIDKFYFNFNPGWAAAGKYLGNVTFDFLKIGDDAVPTGITESLKSNAMVVYPDPALNSISIKNLSGGEVNHITITGMNGQIVKQIRNYNGGFIDVQDLAAGVYNLGVMKKDNTLSNLRFIKQ